MSQTIEHLKSTVGALTAPERADLAYFLLTSLQPEEEGAEIAWRDEIARRMADIRSGHAKGRPVDEAVAELRERYP